MPEIDGQLLEGRALTERECLREGVGHIRKLKECFSAFAARRSTARTPLEAKVNIHGLRDAFRGLALLRGDMRWLFPVRVAERLETELDKEYRAAGRGGSAVAQRTARWQRRCLLLDEMEHRVTALFDRAGAPLLVMPLVTWH